MAVRLGAACFRVRVTFSPVFSVLSRFTSVYQYPVAAKKSARSTSVSASSPSGTLARSKSTLGLLSF